MKIFNQHPAFLVVLGIFIMLFIIYRSLIREKLNKVAFFLGVMHLIGNIVLIFFYENFSGKALEIYCDYVLFDYVLFFFIFLIDFIHFSVVQKYDKLLTDSLKEISVTAYFVVNKKNRIQEISESFSEELGITPKEAYHKNIFDLLEKHTKLVEWNQKGGFTYSDVRGFYKKYKKMNVTDMKLEEREIKFLNASGKLTGIHFIETPIIQMGKYKGRMNIGEKKSDIELSYAEQNLVQRTEELEGIRKKFIATFELSEEGLFYMDFDEKYLWGSDAFKNMLGLEGNTLDLENYLNGIEESDAKIYLEKIEACTEEEPFYSIRYRYSMGNYYVWIEEHGKRIFDGKKNLFVFGCMKRARDEHYVRSNIPDLDNALGEYDLYSDVTKMLEANKTFELVLISLTNIPEINEKYGRKIGNMVLGEYMKKLRMNFMSESSHVYRLEGLLFALTITDLRKMDLLKTTLQSDDTSLNLPLEFGALKVTACVKIGITYGPNDSNDTMQLVECARQALKVSMNPGFTRSFCYYKDVK